MIEALLLGVFGSFHCIGMCGPLILTMPFSKYKYLDILIFNLSRSISYAIIGLFAGLIGQGLKIFDIQQYLTITLGIIICIIATMQFNNKKLETFIVFKKINNGIINIFSKKDNSIVVLGITNGFLPCGLVYVTAIYAISLGNYMNSSLFMFLFGLGTIPAMLIVGLTSKIASTSIRSKLKKSTPFITLLLGILLITRGLNLNIPYISPSNYTQEQQSCH